MAKPILICRLPFESLTKEQVDTTKSQTEDMLGNEYHVLLVVDGEKDIRFEVYNVDKEPEVDYKQLKELINGTRG